MTKLDDYVAQAKHSKPPCEVIDIKPHLFPRTKTSVTEKDDPVFFGCAEILRDTLEASLVLERMCRLSREYTQIVMQSNNAELKKDWHKHVTMLGSNLFADMLERQKRS